MINLAANLTMMFNEVDFLDRFELASRHNFKGIEYLFPYDYPVDQILNKLEENNLQQVLFDLPAGNWESGDRGIAVQSERKGEFQDSVGLAIEYAESLNCKRLTCLAGIPTNKTDDDLAKRTLIENLKFATNNLISTDIVLLLEPINTIDINGFYLTTTSQALEIINDVGSNNLKLQYDIYHMQITEGNIIRTIGKNLEFIHHFQIADNPGRNEPGTGEINYSNILKFIDNSGYKGWVGCEYIPKGNTIDGLKWIEN